MNKTFYFFIIILGLFGYSSPAEKPSAISPARLTYTQSAPARLVSSPFGFGANISLDGISPTSASRLILNSVQLERSATAPTIGLQCEESKSSEMSARNTTKLRASAAVFRPISAEPVVLPTLKMFTIRGLEAMELRYNPFTIYHLKQVIDNTNVLQLQTYLTDIVRQFPRRDRILFYRDTAALLLANEQQFKHEDWPVYEEMIKIMISYSISGAINYHFNTKKDYVTFTKECLLNSLQNIQSKQVWEQYINQVITIEKSRS